MYETTGDTTETDETVEVKKENRNRKKYTTIDELIDDFCTVIEIDGVKI